MPQPIRSPNLVPVDFSPFAILSRPKIAAHIVAISNIWNDIEARTGAFLSSILNADAKVGTAMFLAISNDGAKRAALDAVCALKLSPEENKRTILAFSAVGKASRERNRTVHSAWGTSDKYPHHALLADIKETNMFHADMMRLDADDNDARFARMMEYQKTIMVYGESDLIDIESRMMEAFQELESFSQPFLVRAFGAETLLMPRRPKGPPRGGEEHPVPSES